jgi:AraC-like DNA-binding protein
LQAAKAVIADKGLLMTTKVTVLSDIFSVTGMYLSRPMFVLLYTFWSIGLVISYLLNTCNRDVFPKQGFMIRWLSILLGFSLLLSASSLLMLYRTYVINHQNLYYTLNIFQILSAFGLIGLLISPFLFPNILYGLPKIGQTNDVHTFEEERNISKYNDVHAFKEVPKILENNDLLTFEEERKILEPSFESEYLLELEEKIEVAMSEFQSYLKPDLNISKFAVILQVPCHHLIHYFREVRKQTFNDYRNECRINHAKKMIQEGKAESLTLEAIAFSSGFTTRNTFFTAFKKAEGISPGSFAAKVGLSRS